MKHTTLSAYTSYLWESSGWTVVCQTNLSVTTSGWLTFQLATPFDYDGVSSLMVDFSFNNSSYTSDGYCRATLRSGIRTLYRRTDSGYGDPLTWTGSTPPPSTSSYTPNLRLVFGGGLPAAVDPSVVCLANGGWTNFLTVTNLATNLVLRADDGLGHFGSSDPFDVAATCRPVVTQQPASQTVPEGGTANLCVGLLDAPPLAYQWQFFSTNLAGATSSCLTLIGVSTDQAGPYSVVVTNTCGAVTSAVATLTVVTGVVPVAVFDDPRYMDTGGSLQAESDTIQASLINLGFFVTTFTNIEEATVANSILLFPEQETGALATDLSLTTRAALSNFVASGRLMVVHGAAGRGSALINTVFGLTLTESGTSSTYVQTTDANGTHFADDPVLITNLSLCITLSKASLPAGARSIYENAGATAVALMPFGGGRIIYLAWDWYNAIPLGTANGGWLTVLESAVLEGAATTNGAPTICSAPLSQTNSIGGTATFCAGVCGNPPFSYQWRFYGTNLAGATNPCLTLTDLTVDQAGPYSLYITNTFGSATSSIATLTLIELPPDSTFQIVSLFTNSSLVVDHNAVTGDDRGGIAASATHVFYSGDTATARFTLADLSGGTSLGSIYGALVSDIRTSQVYSLGNGTNLLGSGGNVTTLIALDGVTLQRSGPIVSLNQPISMTTSSAIFAGFGRIVLWNGSRAYDIRLPSGYVTDLGAMSFPVYRASETWAFWGVAEYFGGSLYLTYVRDYQTIVRTCVADGTTTVLASFSNLSDMACITVCPALGRWYFHHEGSSQFGGVNETIGYADAAFNYGLVILPPVVTSGQMQFSFATAEGQSYVTEYKHTLTNSSWIPFQTNVGDGTIQTVTNLITSDPQRFFRLRVVQ